MNTLSAFLIPASLSEFDVSGASLPGLISLEDLREKKGGFFWHFDLAEN